jgi:hypothetical protein
VWSATVLHTAMRSMLEEPSVVRVANMMVTVRSHSNICYAEAVI